MKIRKQDIINVGIIDYINTNYKVLTKKQIRELAVQYMRAVYLRNGQAHVDATLDMIDRMGLDE